MSIVRLKLENDRIEPSLDKIERGIDPILKDNYTFFRAHTPIRSGNARRNTNYSNRTIRADYQYASVLDRGYSNQAPDGMTKPTLNYLNKRLDKLFKG